MLRIWMMLFLAACSGGEATPLGQAPRSTQSAGTVDPNAMDAQPLYVNLCAHCHGENAKGYKADQAPSLVNPTFLESASDEYLRASIARGRPGTSMAGYARSVGGPLDPEAIERVVAWLRSRGTVARALAPVAPGNTTQGAKLYATHCYSCHGDRHTRGQYMMLANARFLEVATDGFLQHAIRYGRPGTPMLPFQGKLTAQEIADLVAYVRSFAQPVDPGRLPAPTGKEPLFVNPKGKPPNFTLRAGRFVSVDDVKAALDAKRKMVIIDARPESDWMTAHITGAVSIPHYQLKRLAEIPKDATIVVYCACPHHLSGLVVDELRNRDYPFAMVLDEGVLEWQRRGYPIIAAPGVEPPPKPPLPLE